MAVRGLPLNTKVQDIKNELSYYGFEGHSVSQMYKGPVSKKVYMPLFHVSLPKNQIELDRNFQITEVKICKYTGKKGPSGFGQVH